MGISKELFGCFTKKIKKYTINIISSKICAKFDVGFPKS